MIKYIFFLSLFFAGCSGCKESGCPDRLLYEIPITITPAQDTLNIGDTLLIESYFNSEMTDLNAKTDNNFIDFDFRGNATIWQIDTDPTNRNTIDDFNVTNVIGGFEKEIFNNADPIYIVKFKYTDSTYSLKSIFVPQKKGTYFFGMGYFQDRYSGYFHAPDNCIKSGVDFYSNTNNRTDNHFSMIKDCPEEFIRRYYTQTLFNEAGGYCFVVK